MQPENTQIYPFIADELRKGIAYHRSGQLTQARDIYNKVLKANPLHPDALHLLGILALESGRLEKAVELISEAIQADPGQPTFYNNLGNVFLQKECLSEAALNYQKAIALKPDYAAAYFNLGNVNQQAKQCRKAISNYCRALEIEPDFVQARFNLANAYRTGNHINRALDSFHEVIRLRPDYAAAYDELASIYDDLSQLDKALVYYEKSLEIRPGCWTSYFNLGNVYRRVNNIEQAVRFYRKALKLNPQSGETYLNLGIAHKAAGNLTEAEWCYHRCIQIKPGLAEAYYNLGNLYNEAGKHVLAIQNYQRSLEINPEMIEVLNNLGELYRQQGLFDAAVECLNRSLEIDPNHPETLHNLGTVLIKINRAEEAIDLFTQVLEIKPDLSVAHNGMGSALLALDRIDEAEACYRQALKIDPVNPGILFNLGVTAQSRGESERSKELFRQAFNLAPELMSARWQYHLLLPVLYDSEDEISYWRDRFKQGLVWLVDYTKLETYEQRRQALEGVGSRSNYHLACQGRNDVALQKMYGKLVARIMGANYPQWSHSRKMCLPAATQKIRIGFVSAYMYSHTVGAFLAGWVKHINSLKFEMYGYHLSPKTDEVTEFFKNCFYRYRQVDSSIGHAAQKISSDNLHILVYFDVGMNPMAIQLAALRLAPVQCKSWGYPVTTGLPTMDYYFSSDLMEPENAQQHYSEELIRLPNLALCYEKPSLPLNPKTRDGFGIDDNDFVYLSAHSLFTYLPQYDDIYPRIAQRVKNTRFVFISHQTETVTRKFEERLSRVFESYRLNFTSCCQILPRLILDNYLSLNLASDVLLDTPAWSGGKTCIEGLSCGLPLVTLPGEFMRGRHAYAMLKMMAVEETIAEDIDQYVDIAVRLGTDQDFYRQIRNKIIKRSHRLFDDVSVPRALEDFIIRTVKEAQAIE